VTDTGEPRNSAFEAGGHSRRRQSIFVALVRKELVDHLHGYRVHVGLIICLVLCGLAGWVRIADVRQAHGERQQFLQRWFPSVEEQLERDENVQIENTRAVSPLSVFAVGLEPTMPFRFTSTKEGLRYGETRAARNTVDALFGYIDVAFVVTVLLSLLAIALTFDSICGERADGTLALLLSYPTTRGTVLAAKIVAATIVLIGCAFPSMLLVVLLMVGWGLPILGGWNLAIFAFAALAYVEFFVLAGTIVSIRVRRRPDAALTAILVWVLVVFAAPRLVTLFVSGFRSPSRAVELALRQDEIESKLKIAFTRRQRQAFEKYVAEARGGQPDVEAFQKEAQAASEELRTQRRVQLARVWEQGDREEASRQRYVTILSAISPSAMFSNVAAELSWTGFVQRDHFYRESRAWDDNFGRRLAESRQAFVASPDEQGISRALVRRIDVRPYMSPFVPTWAGGTETIKAVVVPITVLLAIAGILWGIAYTLFRRLDVRV
jgi:ABC-type transport system involved in multi-copper enzyme maturation permease subunit